MKLTIQHMRSALFTVSTATMILSVALVMTSAIQSRAAYRISSTVSMPPSAAFAAGKQVFQRVIANDTEWAYLAYLPPTYDSTSSKRWPVLYYLPPAGGMYYDGWSGQSLSSLYDSARGGLNGGPAYLLNSPSKCTYISDRFIVISPYMGYMMVNPVNGKPQLIMGLFKHIKGRLKVDTTSTSIMGYCAGGGIGYAVAAAYPQFFSSLVIMSTNEAAGSPCDLTKACSLKDMGFRIYGDRRDPYCPAGAQQAVFDAVHNCPGTKVSITWTNVGQHEIWGAAGLDTVKEMYDWMIASAAPTAVISIRSNPSKLSPPVNDLSSPSRIEVIGLDGRIVSCYKGNVSEGARLMPGLGNGVHVLRIVRGTQSLNRLVARTYYSGYHK